MAAKKAIPFDFIFDELSSLNPHTKPMFGAYGVYIGNKIVFILRQREAATTDNGVWLATDSEHHESLKEIFPNMRSLVLFGGDEDDKPTRWQNLPEDAADFEDSVLKACALILKNDLRIGKVPEMKTKIKAKKKAVKKAAAKKTKSKVKAKPAQKSKTAKKTTKKTSQVKTAKSKSAAKTKKR